MKRKNTKSIFVTIFLVLIVLFLVYFIVAINVSGPYYQSKVKQDQIITQINQEEKADNKVTRYSFKYVTYTSESEKLYRIYDADGELIMRIKKSALALDKVKDIIDEKYPSLRGEAIQISYGYKNGVYLIENDNDTKLMLDIDTLKKVFYMKEGK